MNHCRPLVQNAVFFYLSVATAHPRKTSRARIVDSLNPRRAQRATPDCLAIFSDFPHFHKICPRPETPPFERGQCRCSFEATMTKAKAQQSELRTTHAEHWTLYLCRPVLFLKNALCSGRSERCRCLAVFSLLAKPTQRSARAA